MRWKPHVRFGGRAEETDQPKDRNRASARSDHYFASLLVASGEAIKVVSERLGHSTPAFTMAVYQHVLPGMQRDAANVFARLITPDASKHAPSP